MTVKKIYKKNKTRNKQTNIVYFRLSWSFVSMVP